MTTKKATTPHPTKKAAAGLTPAGAKAIAERLLLALHMDSRDLSLLLLLSQGRLDLNRHLVQNPLATFYVRVTGGSMSGAGIPQGSIMVVDRSRGA